MKSLSRESTRARPAYAPGSSTWKAGRSASTLFPNLVARLHQITGIDPAYQVLGFLMVAVREDEVALHAAELSDPLAETYSLLLLSGAEARALEPGLSPRVAAAVHKPRGAQVYAPSLLQAYTHAAARLGAPVRRGVEVTDLCVAHGHVTGARTADGEEITAGHTVIAGGAWTGHTAAGVGATLPVYAMRGQILALHAIPAPLRHIVFGADVYHHAVRSDCHLGAGEPRPAPRQDRYWHMSTDPARELELLAALDEQA